jgi:hypothetical protein
MAIRKRPTYRRDVDQVPTIPITAVQIMSSPAFELGFSDVHRGIPFDWRDGRWEYERGRLFAHIAPLDMPLRIGGKVNPKAIALYEAASNRRLIV